MPTIWLPWPGNNNAIDILSVTLPGPKSDRCRPPIGLKVWGSRYTRLWTGRKDTPGRGAVKPAPTRPVPADGQGNRMWHGDFDRSPQAASPMIQDRRGAETG